MLYILNFRPNLLSISQLTRDLSLVVCFDEDSCAIQDRIKGLKIEIGKQIVGIYVLDTSSLMNSDSQNIVNPICYFVVDAALWHSRLGHLITISIVHRKILENLLCRLVYFQNSKLLLLIDAKNLCKNNFFFIQK